VTQFSRRVILVAAFALSAAGLWAAGPSVVQAANTCSCSDPDGPGDLGWCQGTVGSGAGVCSDDGSSWCCCDGNGQWDCGYNYQEMVNDGYVYGCGVGDSELCPFEIH